MPAKKRFTEDFIAKWGKTPDSKPDKTQEPLLERQKKLLNTNPNNARLWMAHGETLLDLGRGKEALACFEKVTALDPEHPGLALNTARAQNVVGNYAASCGSLLCNLHDVATKLKHPLSDNIANPEAPEKILQEMAAEELSNPDRQRQVKSMQLLTTVPGLGSLKAKVLFEAGFRTVDDLREASVEELASIEGIALKSAQKIKIIVTLDEKSESIGQPVIDELHLEEEIEEFACPLCSTILETGDAVCYECGMKFKDRGEAAEDGNLLAQLDTINEDIRANPDDIENWFMKGEILSKLEKDEETIEALNEVSRIDPNYPGVWNMKAETFTRMGEHKKAASCYKRAMELGVTAAITKTDEEMEDILQELETVQDDTEIDKALWVAEQKKIQQDLLDLEDKGLEPSDAEVSISDEEVSILDSITKKLDSIDVDIPEELEDLDLDDDDAALIESTVKPLDSRPEPAKPAAPEISEDDEEAIDELTHLFSEVATAKPHETEEITEDEAKAFESITSPIKAQPPTEARQKGLTNGVRKGMTNGLVKQGFVNGQGRTNGMTNGVGRTNGMTNGVGRTNGMTNGVGRTNGLTNGLGRTNGMTNGVGHTNGLTNGITNGVGATNGVTNGITNGLTNGLRTLRSGMTNGLTNGTGLTNGLGGHRFNREARRNKWKLYIIPLAAVLLLIIPMISITAPPMEPDSIIIDGEFSDWASISETTSGAEGTDFNPNVDIISMASENNDDKYLSFHISIVDNGEIFAGEPVSDAGLVDTFHIFLDTDVDPSTGYSIAGIGVDYMIELRGWKGEVVASQILEFTGTDTDDWRGFRATGTTVAEAGGQTVETQIAWSAIGFSEPGPVAAYAHSQSYDGYHDYSDYLVGNSLSILGVTQRSLAPEILSGNGQPLLGFDVKATETDALLNSVQISFKGTAPISSINAVRLEDADGGTVVETTQLSESISLDMGAINVPAGESQSFTLEVDISSSAEAGRTLGAVISGASGIGVESGAASLVTESSSHDLGYIEVVPFGVIIDSGFSDWAAASSDEVGESGTGSNPSVDISKYGAYNDGSKLSFYMRTNGNFMGGASIPHAGGIRAPSSETGPTVEPGPVDSDGDGILDEHEPGFEYDFDNDGISDSEDDDKDNDGETDYDAGGTDEELFNNQTKASKYIGPVDPEPPTNGYDTARIYVDADNDTATGYPRSGLGVDYIIEFTGKYGMIKSSSTKQFAGQTQGEWSWTEIGIPEYGHDTRQVEAMLDIQTTEEISASFETRTWNDNSDEASASGILMEVPQTRSEPSPPVALGAPQDPLYEVTSGNGSAAGDRFGWNVSWAGDVNNDGIDDVIVGAPYVDYGGNADCGAAYIFFGYIGFNVTNSRYMNPVDANVTIYGAAAGDYFGWDVSDAGDVDGDGYNDTIVGAPDALTYSTDRNGSAYIFYGKGLNWEAVTDDGSWDLASVVANVTIVGEAAGDRFGASVSGAGNYDNSGNVDVVVGAYLSNADGTDRGKAYIFYGDGSIPTSAASADVILKGKVNNGHFGFSVSNGGDVDGTAGSEVIVGEPGNDKAYVYYKQIDQVANADDLVSGTVYNDYTYTQTSNDGYEMIEEEATTGGGDIPIFIEWAIPTVSDSVVGGWVNILTLSGASLSPNTDYLMYASFGMVGNDAATNNLFRVTGDTGTLFTGRVEPAGSDDDVVQQDYMRIYTTDASPADVVMEFDLQTAGDIARSTNSFLWMMDLTDLTEGADYKYAENNVAVALTTTLSPQSTITLNGADGVKDWLVLGSIFQNVDSTAANFEMDIYDGSAAYMWFSTEGEDLLEELTWMAHRTFNDVPAATSYSIRARTDAAGGHGHTSSAIFALNLDAFESHDSVYGTASPIPAAMGEIEALSYTPATDGDAIIFSHYRADTTNGADGWADELTIDGTVNPTGWSWTKAPPTRKTSHDATDDWPNNILSYNSITTAGSTLSLRAVDLTGTLGNAVETSITAFSQKLASVPTSKLEHKWTIPVTTGGAFYLEANRTASTDDDNFTFYYTTNSATGTGVTVGEAGWTEMLTVTKTSDDDSYQTYTDSTLEAFIGTLYIGVIDTDRASGNTSKDNISIDHMFIRGVPYNTLFGDSNTNFGWSVADAGNVNNDGSSKGDVVVGAPEYSSSTGRAYVWFDGDFETTTSRTDTSQADFTAAGSTLATNNPNKNMYATSGGDLNLSANYLIYDDFEYATDADFEAEWTINDQTGGYIDPSTDFAVSGSRSAKFSDADDLGALKMSHDFSAIVTGIIEISVYIDSGTVPWVNILLDDDTDLAFSTMQIYFSNDGNIYNNDDGTAYLLQAWSEDTWYNIKVDFDCDVDAADIFVNDVQRATKSTGGRFLNTATDLRAIRIGNDGAAATLIHYIDLVKVYTFDTPGYYDSSTTTAPYYIKAVKPYWNVTSPSGTTSWINISRDGGTTWNQSTISQGTWYTFPTEAIGDQLRYNVTMATTNTANTPVLSDITIYYIYCNPPDVTFTGESPNDKFGYSVHGAGDVSYPADAIDDIIIGAPYNDNATGVTDGGAVYIFNGSATQLTGTIYAWNANYTNYSMDAGSHFGWSVGKAGDLDNDGHNDVAIGAPHFDVISPSMADAGKAWIMSCFCPIEIPEFGSIAGAIFIPLAITFTAFSTRRRKRKRLGGAR